MSQLKMIFDRRQQSAPAEAVVADGFCLRGYRPDDEAAYMVLRERCGFEIKNAKSDLVTALENLRAGGFLLVEEIASKRLVASAMARKGYYKEYDNLSWVMTHPEYRGRSLGRLVCTSALRISLDAGAAGMTLATDDFREPALRLYLRLGWRPWLYTEEDDMRKRWIAVSERLGMDEAAEFNEF